MTPRPSRRFVVGALVCALLVIAVAPGLGGGVVVDQDGRNTAIGSAMLPQQATPTNETVRHEDPDAVNQQGNIADVEQYLASRLAERLDNGSVAISQGQYEQAQATLGDEYDDQLARYVDVAGATDAETDDEAAESFREGQQELQKFSNESAAYTETYEEYEEARRQGNDERARTLARALVDQEADLNQTGRRLQGIIQSIQDGTGRDLSTEQERIETVSRNATEQADTVAETTFSNTRLTATANRSTVSFLRPVTVRGRLVDENGTALANRSVLVGNASEAVRAETNATGQFQASYRPARLPVEPGEVPVRFEPENASVYLGNMTTVLMTVEPVTPTVTAAVTPATAAFNETVWVSGAVTVNETPVTGVPVGVSIDGVRMAAVETNRAGHFDASVRLPDNVTVGARQVDARLNQTGRAVSRASATAALAVDPTATALMLNGTLGMNETVVVSGRLRTTDGQGVGNRSVQLLIDGDPVKRVSTGADGRFSARIPPSGYEVGEDGNVTVAARFDRAGTNLEGSAARMSLAAPWVQSSGLVAGRPAWQWIVGVAALGIVAAGGAVAWRRGRNGDDSDADDGDGTGTMAAAGPSTDASGSVLASGDEAWRDDSAALLKADKTDRAVVRAYGAARARLAEEMGVSGALTHWEFYAVASEDGVAVGRVESLLALTETYERARFAPTSVSATDAAAAMDSAGEILGE